MQSSKRCARAEGTGLRWLIVFSDTARHIRRQHPASTVEPTDPIYRPSAHASHHNITGALRASSAPPPAATTGQTQTSVWIWADSRHSTSAHRHVIAAPQPEAKQGSHPRPPDTCPSPQARRRGLRFACVALGRGARR